MIKYITILCLFLVITSCKTVTIEHSSQSITNQKVTLGSIGLDKNQILEHNYSATAIPSYEKPIKLSVSKIPFSKITYNAFTKAKKSQNATISIKYVDSLDNKPQFLKLDIADKVTLIEALNNRKNKNVQNYLSTNYNASIITSISIAFDSSTINKITNAESVFLIENNLKSYVIGLFENGKITEYVSFNKGIVFTYDSSNCCWQANNAHRVNIVDIVIGKTSCPNKTYPSAKQAKRKINYFKL